MDLVNKPLKLAEFGFGWVRVHKDESNPIFG
jgi:hypothetical protein